MIRSKSQASAKSTTKLEALMSSLQFEFGAKDGASDSSAPVNVKRQSRRSSIAGAAAKRLSKSVPRLNSGADDQSIVLTLASLQASGATLSAFLHKLNGHPTDQTAQQQFKPRYFVLTQNGNLHLFKSNNNPNAIPITYLPLSSVSAHTDSFNSETVFIMRANGDGISFDGTIVKRQWTIRFPDEETLLVWIRSIQRILLLNSQQKATSASSSASSHSSDAQKRLSETPSASLSFDLPRASSDYVRPSVDAFRPNLYQQQRNSGIDYSHQQPAPQPYQRGASSSGSGTPLYGRSNSIGSSLSGHSFFTNRSNPDNSNTNPSSPITTTPQNGFENTQQQHAMHQEYLVKQRTAAERYRLEQQAKRESEERKRDVELQRIKGRELEISNQEMYHRANQAASEAVKKQEEARMQAEKLKASMG
ncbi:UNVERIFIED_CONTAM: hypothetical protein HDU68_002752, partial [Siphonaria sp. JEL0065]